MLNLKELFSLQMRCNETNESDEKSQESNQGRQRNMCPFSRILTLNNASNFFLVSKIIVTRNG